MTRIRQNSLHHHHHHHQCLASVFPCTHGSDVSPKIFLLHNCLSWASPTFKPKSFMSLLTHCNHVFLPLPLPTFPTTFTFVHFLTQSSSAFAYLNHHHHQLPSDVGLCPVMSGS